MKKINKQIKQYIKHIDNYLLDMINNKPSYKQVKIAVFIYLFNFRKFRNEITKLNAYKRLYDRVIKIELKEKNEESKNEM